MVAYDALNKETVVSGDWESTYWRERVPAFQYQLPSIWAVEVTVADYEVNLACIAEISTQTIDDLQVFLSRTENDFTNISNELPFCYLGDVISTPINSFILAYDYESLASPISDYLAEYIWRLRVNDSQNISVLSCELVDNYSDEIASFSSSEDGLLWQCDVDLRLGDLDYNGIVDINDFNALYSYTSGNVLPFSNLKMVLADLNSDGVVNTYDTFLLQQQVLNSVEKNSADYYLLQQVMSNLLAELQVAEEAVI